MQWVMKKRSYWEFGELLNPGVKTLIYAMDPCRLSQCKAIQPQLFWECIYETILLWPRKNSFVRVT